MLTKNFFSRNCFCSCTSAASTTAPPAPAARVAPPSDATSSGSDSGSDSGFYIRTWQVYQSVKYLLFIYMWSMYGVGVKYVHGSMCNYNPYGNTYRHTDWFFRVFHFLLLLLLFFGFLPFLPGTLRLVLIWRGKGRLRLVLKLFHVHQHLFRSDTFLHEPDEIHFVP